MKEMFSWHRDLPISFPSRPSFIVSVSHFQGKVLTGYYVSLRLVCVVSASSFQTLLLCNPAERLLTSRVSGVCFCCHCPWGLELGPRLSLNNYIFKNPISRKGHSLRFQEDVTFGGNDSAQYRSMTKAPTLQIAFPLSY